MSKKELTAEEREKLGQEIVEGLKDCLNDYSDNGIHPLESILGPVKKPKSTREMLRKYHILVERSVDWSSRQTYLDLLKSFLSKEIDGVTFC